MKIAYCSDLHLDFGTEGILLNGKLHPNMITDADVLILAGDIIESRILERVEASSIYWMRQDVELFFKLCKEQYKHVIYIAGNHEFYGSRHVDGIKTLMDFCHNNNIYFLENNFIMIDDVLFYGGTMWTDFNKGNPHSMYTAEVGMNDFKVIKRDGYGKFKPCDAIEIHKTYLKHLKNGLHDYNQLEHIKNFVAVSHHAPTPLSCEPQFESSSLNAAFHTNLFDFIHDSWIDFWVHGHTHTQFEYNVGNCKVLCNPRGYQNNEWQLVSRFKIKTFEV